jgi:hypothetical protein
MFIQNKQDYLTDKYGRIGYLENRGEYYVFQPIEISDEKASIFERSVPVNYKRDHLTLELPQRGQFPQANTTNVAIAVDVPQPTNVPDKDNANDKDNAKNKDAIDTEPSSDSTTTNVSTIIQRVIDQYMITEKPRETKGLDKNWYKNASNVLEILEKQHNLSREILSKYIVFHSLDEMSFQEKRLLLNHFYGKSGVSSSNTEHETRIMEYFDEKRMKNDSKNRMGILLANKDEVVLLIRSLDDTAPEWVVSEEDDIKYFKEELVKHTVDKSRLNRIIGYIVNFKDKEMVFKFKDITLTRNKLGARCDSAGKADILKMLNAVIASTSLRTALNPEEEPKEIYTQENTATLYQPRLCVILEMLLREYTRVSKNNRVYFLTPEQTILGEITRYTTANS